MMAAFADFLDYLRLNRNVSPHTVRAYESDLRQFLDHVGRARGPSRTEIGRAHV